MTNVVKPFINKEVSEMPDWYQLTVFFTNGTKEEIKVVSHKVITRLIESDGRGGTVLVDMAVPFLEYVTFEDTYGWIPISSMSRMTFDKNWTKIVELKRKEREKQNAQKEDASKAEEKS